MNNNLFQLELLPNEILINIFEFFHPEQLFQAFYNLNSRFNMLLQSLYYLSLILSTNSYNKEIFLYYVRILTINRAIDINLNYFTQIRYLILRYPTDKILAQLNGHTLPYLQHLSINHMHISILNSIPNLCDKIFSNDFLTLKSCYLFPWLTITKISKWTQLPSLCILKIGKIDLLIYKIILSSCPNLYFLQLATITSNNTSFHINQHTNLKRMIIKTKRFVQPWKDDDINSCLSYVPYLEYLSVHRTEMIRIVNYDWLASIIACHLPYLRQFVFYFHVFDTQIISESNNEIILNEMKKKFEIFHPNYYQSRFILLIEKTYFKQKK